jgi:hypothetical protein
MYRTKGADKLYITHSEWSSSDAFGNARGANSANRASAAGLSSTFKRLPFNYCAVSLQPFTDPVCTSSGTIFDLTHILTWLSKHPDTNPVDGTPLKRADLITLNFTKNEDGEYVDPVTYKVFTDNTHIVALEDVVQWVLREAQNVCRGDAPAINHPSAAPHEDPLVQYSCLNDFIRKPHSTRILGSSLQKWPTTRSQLKPISRR